MRILLTPLSGYPFFYSARSPRKTEKLQLMLSQVIVCWSRLFPLSIIRKKRTGSPHSLLAVLVFLTLCKLFIIFLSFFLFLIVLSLINTIHTFTITFDSLCTRFSICSSIPSKTLPEFLSSGILAYACYPTTKKSIFQ